MSTTSYVIPREMIPAVDWWLNARGIMREWDNKRLTVAETDTGYVRAAIEAAAPAGVRLADVVHLCTLMACDPERFADSRKLAMPAALDRLMRDVRP